MRSRVRVIKDKTKAIRTAMDTLARSKSYVKAGLLGTKKAARSGDSLTNAEIGIINEYGTSRQPARPFVKPSFDQNRKVYEKHLATLAKRVVSGQRISYERALGIVGLQMAADMRKFVTQGAPVPPPNAPSTLRRKTALTRRGSKGSVRTLVDSGRMVNALTHEVVRSTK
jgi:hypothetical protein